MIRPDCAEQVPASVKLAAAARSEGALATLIIPIDPATLGANRSSGRHWGKLCPLKADAQLCARWAYVAAGEPRIEVPVNTDLLVFRRRAMDHENALLGLKAALDELVRCGLLPNDSPTWWQWGEIQWITGSAFERSGAMKPWCLLTLRAREERRKGAAA